MNRIQKDDIEIGISGIRKLTEVIRQKHGFDLGNYASTSLKRRIAGVIIQNDLKNLDGLISKLENQPTFFSTLQTQIAVEGTEFFRDPAFWRTLRDEIFKTISRNNMKIRIWIPACSSGEEVISTAITLREANVSENSVIYATDINQEIIEKSKNRVYSNTILEISENNYKRFREDESAEFSKYYTSKGAGFSFSPDIYKNIEYKVFNEANSSGIKSVNLIICRNHFIYLTSQYQEKLFEIFTDKLSANGFFAIGNKENISFCKDARKYVMINENEKIFRKNS
jgi:chemotaxis protein methyltransferase CheR